MPNLGTGLSGELYQSIALLVSAGPLGALVIVVPIAALLVRWCWMSGEPDGAGAIASLTAMTLVAVAAFKVLSNLLITPWQPYWSTVSDLFPSGHVAMAVIVYGALTLCAMRAHRWLGITTGVLASVVVIGVALERYMSGSHPMLDILGGAVIGFAALILLVRKWPSGRLRPSGFPAVAFAGGIIAVGLYGVSLPTSLWVEHTVKSVRSTVPIVLNGF